MERPSARAARRAAILVAIGLVWIAGQWAFEGRVSIGDIVVWERAGADPRASSGVEEIERLYAERLSDRQVRFEGEVSRVLSDDNEGSRHQRFIVELSSGRTVLIAHNIDLAPRVPLRRGERVEIYGEYEWNERGGVVHWTHRDPRGRHPHGWIRHDGRVYE